MGRNNSLNKFGATIVFLHTRIKLTASKYVHFPWTHQGKMTGGIRAVILVDVLCGQAMSPLRHRPCVPSQSRPLTDTRPSALPNPASHLHRKDREVCGSSIARPTLQTARRRPC